MINVCQQCGHYRADKLIDPAASVALCPLCHHPHPFRHLPLLVVCGPSGAGKSAVCQHLVGTVEEAVLLDADILWRPEFNQPDEQYRDFFETWLRLGKNIAQSGRPLVLFCAGGLPDNIEPCVERRYFSAVYYLALICQDDILTARLKQRPAWRESHAESFIAEQFRFNGWLQEQARLPHVLIQALDTSREPLAVTATQVGRWIKEKIDDDHE